MKTIRRLLITAALLVCAPFAFGQVPLLVSSVRGAAGSAAAPTFTFTPQTSTGFYQAATGEIDVSVAGTKTLQFYPAGQIFGAQGNNYLQLNAAGQAALVASGTNQSVVITPSGTGQIVVPVGAVGTPIFAFAGDATTGIYQSGAGSVSFATLGAASVRITTGGQIIGTTGGGLLQLGTNGQITATASGTNQSITLTPSGTGSVTNSVGIYDTPAATNAVFKTSGTTALTLDGSQNATFGGWIRAADGSLSAPGYTFTNDPNTGIDRPSADNLRLITGGVAALTLDSSQNATFAGNASVAGTGLFSDALSSRTSNVAMTISSSVTSSTTLNSFNFFTATRTNTSGATSSFQIQPTYNQASGTAANTDLLINRGQTAVGSGAQLLIDAQVSSTSKFSVSNTGAVTTAGLVSTYNGIATAGNGVVSVQGAARATAQTGANASVATYTVGASDASFEVSANILVTTATTHAFTCTCAYTDEGSTARTITFTFSNVGGTLLTSIANTGGTVPYEGVPLHIRAKASTAITIATTGTFTSVVYNVEGVIRKLQ